MVHFGPILLDFVHVEHGVGGTEHEPVNRWRIVVLTELADPRYVAAFAKATAAGGLPGFLEVYLTRDLGVTLRQFHKDGRKVRCVGPDREQRAQSLEAVIEAPRGAAFAADFFGERAVDRRVGQPPPRDLREEPRQIAATRSSASTVAG